MDSSRNPLFEHAVILDELVPGVVIGTVSHSEVHGWTVRTFSVVRVYFDSFVRQRHMLDVGLDEMDVSLEALGVIPIQVGVKKGSWVQDTVSFVLTDENLQNTLNWALAQQHPQLIREILMNFPERNLRDPRVQ